MALGTFANVVTPFEYLKQNLPSLVQIQQQLISQSDVIETQRNVRIVKKIYGDDNGFKKKEKSIRDEQVDLGGVAGMTKLGEASRVTNIIKDNKELIHKLNRAEEDAFTKQLKLKKQQQQSGAKGKQATSPSKQDDEEVRPISPQYELKPYYKPRIEFNERIHTPNLQRLAEVGDDDGQTTLRREIDDSMRRVRAARKGQSIVSMSP